VDFQEVWYGYHAIIPRRPGRSLKRMLDAIIRLNQFNYWPSFVTSRNYYWPPHLQTFQSSITPPCQQSKLVWW